MSKTVLVEDRPTLKFIYAVNLQTYADTTVINCSSLEQALTVLKEEYTSIDLIITRSHIDDLEVALKLTEYMLEKEIELPMLVLGECDKKVQERSIILNDPPLLKELVQIAAQALGVTAQMMASKKVANYYPFAISTFSVLSEAPCDIFTLYKKAEHRGEQDEYQLIFKQGENIPKKSFLSILTTGVPFLFVRSRERLDFANAYSNTLQQFLTKDTVSEVERVEKTDNIYTITSETLSEIGMTDESVQLIQISVASIQRIAEGNSTINKLLSGLLNENYSFRYKHSQLITMLSHKILDELGWGEKEIKEKLAFVAFLHDIALKNDDDCKIHSQEELDQAGLSAENYHLVLNHARMASKFIQSYPKAPLEAFEIVEMHHGSPSGVGFGGDYKRVTPLMAVFLIAEEFSLRILKAHAKGIRFNWKKQSEEVGQHFPQDIFKKMIEALTSHEIEV